MFVENILHSGKSNGKTTAAARDVHERRMRAYGQLLNTELLQEARKNLEKIQKGNVDSGPLTPKDVYTKAWEGKKPNKQMSTIIKSLKDEGRKLELLWKASTKGTIYLEQQRSFRPTALQGLGINDQMPSLMLLAALTVWDHGEELPAHDLPLECRKFIENLPGLLSAAPVNTGSSLEIHRDISLTPLPIHEE